ncbi:MAG: hypothetical protein IKZ13_07000 [Akkermansia sp.]|nr:hypothetical protein [Akkermansia sp.]
MNTLTQQTTNGWDLLENMDAIYVDACTWMSPEIESALQQSAPHIRKSGHKFLMTANVRKELENCANLKPAAQTALQLCEQYSELIDVEPGEGSNGTADGEFLRLLFFNHLQRRQLLITHDQQLTADIINCCPGNDSGTGNITSVMTLWPDGSLITFAEMNRRKDYQARMRLAEMVGNSPVYMDSSALTHELAGDFLEHISTPLEAQEKSLKIISNSLNNTQESRTAELLATHAALVQIIPSQPALSETDALLGELYLSPDNMDKERLILVTEDVARANELRCRRPKCDRFPFIDFMTINKYGYLSYLKLSEPPTTPTPRIRQRLAQTTDIQPSPDENGERLQRNNKPAAFVPQLIGAIKSNNVDAMRTYIAKGANLRNGIITSLCQCKDECLRALISEAAQPIEASTFEWWITDFNASANPSYLAQNEEHYRLLQMLIERSASLEGTTGAMMVLADRVSSPEGAHRQLWHIIRMALSHGAPEAVYSRATGETLPEIARRQGNDEMLRFLQSR